MRRSNVLQFPSDNSGGIRLKWFAVIFYLFLAFLLTFLLQLSEGGLWLLLLLGLLYNFFVRRRNSFNSYFRSHPILLSIMLLILLLSFLNVTVPILLIAGLYWLMIGRTGREAPYFLRFHILTGLILNFLILLSFLIVNAAIMLAGRSLMLANLDPWIAPALLFYTNNAVYLMLGIFWGVAVWLSISALMGRTPYVRIVTDNVRHWA